MILLDSDICIEILRGNQRIIEKRMLTDEITAVSFITVGELYYGAERSKYKLKNTNIVDEFILSIDIIDSDFEIMKKFAQLKSEIYKKNIMLPDADIIIAATALTKCSKLITGNIKHFERFPNLIIENWIG